MSVLFESEEPMVGPVGHGQICLRDELVNIALRWQEKFGVAPFITPTISEYDAAMLVGMSQSEYSACMRDRTAVSRGWDFKHEGKRYQVKACRPSGKPGSEIRTVPGAGNNKDWDFIICVLYDVNYVMLEAWQLPLDQYMAQFGEKKNLSPYDYRTGRNIFQGSLVEMPVNNLSRHNDVTFIHNDDVIGESGSNGHNDSALSRHLILKNESKRDLTEYVFDGMKYGKGRLVLAVIKKWVLLNCPKSFHELLKAFPQELRSGKIFATLSEAKLIKEREPDRVRHFTDDPILLPDFSEVVVVTGWDKYNIVKFLSRARDLGFFVDVVK